MDLVKTGRVILRFVQCNAPIIISAAAGIGIAALYILTIKETEEAVAEINEVPEEEVHSFKMAKKIAKIYVPSFLVLIFTMFCIAESIIMSQHRIRDLTNYSAMLAATIHQYRQRNIQKNSEDLDHEIMNEVILNQKHINKDAVVKCPEEGILCLLYGYPRYFVVEDQNAIFNAFSTANEHLNEGSGTVELAQWMKWANAWYYDDHGRLKPGIDQRYIHYGWDSYELTKNNAVSNLYPYVGRIEEESGLVIHQIDVPVPQPLETKWDYAF